MLRPLKKNRHNPDYKVERKRLEEFVICMTAKDVDNDRDGCGCGIAEKMKCRPQCEIGEAEKRAPGSTGIEQGEDL